MKESVFDAPHSVHSSYVGHPAVGHTLLRFLSERFTYFSADQWQERIRSGEVLLNGQARPESASLLRLGDEVRYLAIKRPEPPVPTHIPVIYEDADLLIVNKPPHLPVHPGGRYLRHTLIHLLQHQRRYNFLVLSHRLDRETSGLCVLSKTPLAKDKMYWAFFNGEVEKTYWALVWGKPHPASGTIDAPIGTAQGEGSKVRSRIRIKQAVGGADSKSARTKYHTLSTHFIEAPQWNPPPWPALLSSVRDPERGPWPISLVECRPLTGRTNQIRVHLASIGAGVVGDKLYDPDEEVFIGLRSEPLLAQASARQTSQKLSSEMSRRLVLDAHALHAKVLEFRHPRTGKAMRLEAPVPKSWGGLYQKKSGKR